FSMPSSARGGRELYLTRGGTTPKANEASLRTQRVMVAVLYAWQSSGEIKSAMTSARAGASRLVRQRQVTERGEGHDVVESAHAVAGRQAPFAQALHSALSR